MSWIVKIKNRKQKQNSKTKLYWSANTEASTPCGKQLYSLTIGTSTSHVPNVSETSDQHMSNIKNPLQKCACCLDRKLSV